MSTDVVSARRRRTLFIYVGYLVALMLFFGPVLFMLWSAFRTHLDITSTPLDVTSALSADNFVRVFDRFDFGRYIVNSVIIAGGSTALGLLFGAPAAYVIVLRQWSGLAFVMLLARMAPGVMFVLPFFIFSVAVGAPSNTALNYTVLVLAHVVITLPLCIWLLVPFFESVPASLDEAAMIDGATIGARFIKVALPLVAPGLAVAVTLSFVFSWNYFLFALALSNNDTIPLPAIAFTFIGEGQSDYGGLMAASTLISLPALVLATTAQRWLVRGLTAGAVK
ncbi:carbohydrate ABC transporter permease [Phytoactinopolyspora endophytica]|uniref:carbohydrate ABC transporter permease n=1 Tax=Phytoactinopolyspora endophytica TaxID=1642495 RepID=UPI0013EA16C5|nr:carbohydrate ABC transporter permease [Phytoactinopolyspora endophytica]